MWCGVQALKAEFKPQHCSVFWGNLVDLSVPPFLAEENRD